MTFFKKTPVRTSYVIASTHPKAIHADVRDELGVVHGHCPDLVFGVGVNGKNCRYSSWSSPSQAN